jgi:phosphate transport system substrate-binding protein
MIGSDAAMAGLYTGQADVAFLGREATASEAKAFEWIFRTKPARIEVATGSLGTPGQSPALVVFVHRDNPLTRLDLSQLDAVFGAERKRGAPAAVETWGQLGLKGAWATQPIHLYAPDADTGTGRFFQEAALGDSRKLNWARLREFGGDDAGAQILASLANDQFGLAIAELGPTNPSVKSLALAVTPHGPWVAATRDSVIARTYPLSRIVLAYINRKPDRAPDPAVREFLRYILSREGQDDITRAGVYLPLAEADAQAQRASLD